MIERTLRWIPVSERLPPYGATVLVAFPRARDVGGHHWHEATLLRTDHNGHNWKVYNVTYFHATHWAEVPLP